MLRRFHLIPERHGQTDRRTNIIATSISCISVLTREKIAGNISISGLDKRMIMVLSYVPMSVCMGLFLSRVSILTRDIIENLSVRPSVRLSVTFRYQIKTA